MYPATVIVYLSHFPKERMKQTFYIIFWIILYVLAEIIGLHVFGLIDHFNGWNMWWSFLFDIILFGTLYIHYKRPILAWGLSIIVILFFLNVFDVTLFDLHYPTLFLSSSLMKDISYTPITIFRPSSPL